MRWWLQTIPAASLRRMLIHRGQKFVRRKTADETFRPENPAHGSRAVDVKGGRRIGICSVRAVARIEHLHGLGELLLRVGNDAQGREALLRERGRLRVIAREPENP